MATIYYDRDADPAAITGKTVAVIGYGSQGHAHAQNLRDSGCQVIVGLAAGSKSWQRAGRDGFEVRAVPDAVRGADVVALLVPDQHHREVYEKGIAPFLGRGRTLLVAHAFSVHFGEVKPSADIDVVLVAPRAGVITTTFAEEVETDLFGEQAVLCGGISELVKAGFETLVEAGYQPEIAYFECMNESKLIVDLMYEGGLSYMRYSVSDTAEFVDYTSGPRVIDERVRATMRQILGEVRDGSFAQKWIGEYRRGAPTLYATRAREQAQPIEEVGRRLRALMPWLPKRDAPSAAD